jgi:hypothetical protein
MIRRLLLPLFAVAGLTLAIIAIVLGDRAPPAVPVVVETAASPFATYVAGAAIVETDGVAEMSIVRHTAWLRMFRWRRIDGLWRAVVVAL